jgi:NadR type nicotinamide-nucleotide adenylyltransferase
MPVKDLKKIAIIGPECTGKSELSKFLADYYKTVWIPEYAREYLDSLGRPYEERDLLNIAQGQLRSEDEWEQSAHDVMICDTNLYVIKIWSIVKFGTCDPHILNAIATRKYDLYLLTYVDILWEDDPLREHPDKRQQLYDFYLSEMINQPVPFVQIKGAREQRRESAITAIKRLLMK